MNSENEDDEDMGRLSNMMREGQYTVDSYYGKPEKQKKKKKNKVIFSSDEEEEVKQSKKDKKKKSKRNYMDSDQEDDEGYNPVKQIERESRHKSGHMGIFNLQIDDEVVKEETKKEVKLSNSK